MIKEGNVVVIDAQMDNTALSALAKELSKNIDGVEEIAVNLENGVESSAFFSLLFSIQTTYPDIKISILDEETHSVDGVGTFSLEMRG